MIATAVAVIRKFFPFPSRSALAILVEVEEGAFAKDDEVLLPLADGTQARRKLLAIEITDNRPTGEAWVTFLVAPLEGAGLVEGGRILRAGLE